MKNYIRNGARILFDYFVTLIIFVILIYIFLSITKDNFNKLLPIYCIFIFIFAFILIYSEMARLAQKEKKPQYDLKPYPLKGLVYGAVGFLPVAFIEVLSTVIVFKEQFVDHLKHVFINVLMGPLYFIIRFMDEKPLGYALASLVIPVVAMLGYMAGYYGFSTGNLFKKADNKTTERAFTKSPWNPTNSASGKPAKKKKRKITGKV